MSIYGFLGSGNSNLALILNSAQFGWFKNWFKNLFQKNLKKINYEKQLFSRVHKGKDQRV